MNDRIRKHLTEAFPEWDRLRAAIEELRDEVQTLLHTDPEHTQGTEYDGLDEDLTDAVKDTFADLGNALIYLSDAIDSADNASYVDQEQTSDDARAIDIFHQREIDEDIAKETERQELLLLEAFAGRATAGHLYVNGQPYVDQGDGALEDWQAELLDD